MTAEWLVVAVGARLHGGVPNVECYSWRLERKGQTPRVVPLPEPEVLAARLAARTGAPC